MKISVIAILVIGLSALLVVSLPMAVMAEGLLDDKAFTTLLDGDNDVLTFQDGMFHSSSCDDWGFGQGQYTTQQTDNGIAFQAKTNSEKHGTMVWTGTVQGDSIKGSYLWTKEGWFGTKSKTKNFAGSLKQ